MPAHNCHQLEEPATHRQIGDVHIRSIELVGTVLAEVELRLLGLEGPLDLPGFCGERLAHFRGLSLEGDGALEAER